MSRKLRIISINFAFASQDVVLDSLESDRALFDFDIVLIRPPQFDFPPGKDEIHWQLKQLMKVKRSELDTFFLQGGVLVVLLDVPDYYHYTSERVKYGVNNYEFLDKNFAAALVKGKGTQITYSNVVEPFIDVLKKSTIEFTAYLPKVPITPPLSALKFFAHAGAGGAVAGKMPYSEGHLILLPNLTRLDEQAFFEACAEYRFTRQGSTPPEWMKQILVPGIASLEAKIVELDTQIAELQNTKQLREQELEERSAYRKLLYEKGKTQLEPIVLRALDDLEFGTTPSEIIKRTNYQIDGRTTKGSTPGILETKGSKNQIAQSEFSPLVIKLLADSDVSHSFSKGILVGNGLCETEPGSRLGDTVFTPHVLDGAKRNSVALINSVELYWLCCALLRGDNVDKNAIREAILTANGYVDLKPFSGTLPFS
jgi:hypothetical protein